LFRWQLEFFKAVDPITLKIWRQSTPAVKKNNYYNFYDTKCK